MAVRAGAALSMGTEDQLGLAHDPNRASDSEPAEMGHELDRRIALVTRECDGSREEIPIAQSNSMHAGAW